MERGKIPRIHLNCAASLDGKLAAPDGAAMAFSDELDWRRVHTLRANVDAILVGVGTIVADDPSLRVKSELAPVPVGRKLIRVILDPRGRTPRGARALDGSAPTFILTGPDVSTTWPNATALRVPLGDGGLDLRAAMEALHAQGIRSVLVEGGGKVLRSFLATDLVEKWTLYQAPVLVGGTGPSIFDGKPSLIGRRLHVENVVPQGKGVLWTFRP